MSQYFENDRNLKSVELKKKVIINGNEFIFITDNGVFSKKGLDFGTRILLSTIPDDIKGECLDIGCGYGPIGIYLNKIFNADVDMVDVNERSLKLTIKNAILNKAIVNAFESDAFLKIKKRYDYIITNPPIRVGKEKLYEIVFGAVEHLKENGKLYFVINKDQGAKSIYRDLTKKYNAEIVNKEKGFFIICVHNN